MPGLEWCKSPELDAEDRARRSAARAAAYRATPEYRTYDAARRRLRRFCLTAAAFAALVAGGPHGPDRCWSCGTQTPGGTGTWAVDHDRECCPDKYSCGMCIRGLLCRQCNGRHGEGNNMDTIVGARAWLHYLENAPLRAQQIIASACPISSGDTLGTGGTGLGQTDGTRA